MISIIIPCFNDANSLIHNIPPILNFCDEINGELIIINDGSTDDLSNKIKKFNHKKLIYIEQSNQGVSVARNNGIKLAKKEKILFIDSDDYINYDGIVKNIDNISNSDFVFWNSKKIFKNGKIINYEIDKKNKSELMISILMRENHLFMGSFIISRKIALNILFDTRFKYGEDLKFIYESLNLANNILKIEDVYLYYIQRNNSSMYTFNNRRFDSLDALSNLKINDEYRTYINKTIKYDRKVILNSFIKSFSLFQFRKALAQHIRMEEIIETTFGPNKKISKIKFYLYSILYKIYFKIKS